ncbi:MAG TPA: hypothetical protein PLF01_06835 [Alphaproteobacteria bacterium]|nr:hypothetical protein [Alphaproteobacteria bacterium]
MARIKNFIENNFSLLLLLGCAVGFFTPSFGAWASQIVIFLTASLIFLSCADIKPSEFLKVDIFQMALFTILRFAVFPLILFYAMRHYFPEYAVGTLLLALMPAGVAVASLCSMGRANVALGLSLTIITSLLAPAFIPGVFSFLGQVVKVDIMSLFMTLVMVILVPIFLYFGVFSRFKKINSWVSQYNKSSAIVILSLVLVIVVATQKREFLANLDVIYIGLMVMTGLFAIFYLFGILYSLVVPKDQKIPYIFASGAMNNSLAVGLAFAYFDAKVTLFLVLSEIVWSVYVALAQWVLSKRRVTS